MAKDDEKKREQKADPAKAAPVLNYASPVAGEFVVIATFPSEAEARMAASKLDGEGVRVMVSGMGGFGLELNSNDLAVAKGDKEKAIEILKGTPARLSLLKEKGPTG